MIIRNEKQTDIERITEITIQAFEKLAVSHQTEHFIIKALREAGALTLSLVAEIDDEVVGHIALSPVEISDGSTGWAGLGPVSVLPEYQKRGIGSALITTGIVNLQKRKAQGCVLVGDPGYYNRFGFKNHPQLYYESIPQKYFMILPFTESIPAGKVEFHKAFKAEM